MCACSSRKPFYLTAQRGGTAHSLWSCAARKKKNANFLFAFFFCSNGVHAICRFPATGLGVVRPPINHYSKHTANASDEPVPNFRNAK